MVGRSGVAKIRNFLPRLELAVDIRKFELDTTASPKATVEFSAKLLDSDGKVVAAKIFTADAPASAADNAGIAASAIGTAFSTAASDLIVWALDAMDTAAAARSRSPPRFSERPTASATEPCQVTTTSSSTLLH